MTSLLGAGYDSSSEDEASLAPSKATSATTVAAAPDVSIEVWSQACPILAGRHSNILQERKQMQIMVVNSQNTALAYNVSYDNLARPAQGPANPFKSTNGNTLKRKNVLTGHAEETSMSDASFNTLHRTYQSLGYTQDPTVDGAFVGKQSAVAKYGGRDVVQMRSSKEESAAIRAKRQKKGDSSIVEGDNAYVGPWAKYQGDDIAYEEEEAVAGQALASDEEWVEEGIVPTHLPAPPKAATSYQDDVTQTETTEFHGSSQFDYQGRTYMHVPTDPTLNLKKEPGSQECFVPNKLIHVYKSHTKPITSLRFFPYSSHLLLSSSADSTVKLWDAHHDRELLRTFSGHGKSVTDTDFHPSGKTFLSASFDRQMKLWDTEYGKCISRFSTGKTPHCIRFNPADGGNEFLAGMSDKKIVQFDTRSGEMTQEYDHHLGPINSLTFVDENRRFISTSDDKSLRAWEYNIPVPIKFIADPSMFALTRSSAHPSGKYVAFQSADNQIVVYAAGDKFRQNRKKGFRGHNTSGYAIDVAISPDGKFIASGDSAGRLFFWDWKTGKRVTGKRNDDEPLHAGGEGNGAVTCVAWHLQETSKVATGGLDGVIRYWD
jgi:pre-mRNA-processing factor 17